MSSLLLIIQVGFKLFGTLIAKSSGTTKDDEDVSGTITVPEVAHDTEENEYVVRLLVPQWVP